MSTEDHQTDPEPETNEHSSVASESGSRVEYVPTEESIRWWPPVAIFVMAGIVEMIVWRWCSEDRHSQATSIYAAAGMVGVLLLAWWMFASRVPWRTRFIGLGVALLLGISARVLLRVEFTGEMFPILSFRFSATAEEKAAEYRKSLQPDEAKRPDTIEVVAGDWIEFRGPNREGIVNEAGIRQDWNERPPREVWRHPVGLGWSSFAVVGGLAFTQEQRDAQECVVCYDAESGREIWVHADSVRFSESLGSDGPRATPTFSKGLLYAQGATGRLNCLDARTGELIWSKNVLEDNAAKLPHWGMAGSPLVVDDRVVVNPGGPDRGGLVAYDRMTGDRIWSGGDDPASYSSPHLAFVQGSLQVLIFDGVGLAGHDASSGSQLWKFPWTTGQGVNAVQPYVIDHSEVLISNGYGVGSTLLRINRDSENWSVEQLWKSIRLKAKFNDFVVKEGFIYGLDEGVLACLDLETGKRRWKGGRYGYGQLLLVDGDLLVLTEAGAVVLVAGSPDAHQPLAKFQAIKGKTWNHPALVRGRLFVRNAREAACYDISP